MARRGRLRPPFFIDTGTCCAARVQKDQAEEVRAALCR